MIRWKCSIWILRMFSTFVTNITMDVQNKISLIRKFVIFHFFVIIEYILIFLGGNICNARNVEQWNILQWWIPIVFQNVHYCIAIIFIIKMCIWLWELNKRLSHHWFWKRWKFIQIYDHFEIIQLKNMQRFKYNINIFNWFIMLKIKIKMYKDILKIHFILRHCAFWYFILNVNWCL